MKQSIKAQFYYQAIRRGSLDAVKAARRLGAKINLPGPGGLTPLLQALDENKLRIAEFLLEEGADPCAKAPRGMTSLILAARNATLTPIIPALLAAGVDKDAHETFGGYTALALATEKGNLEAMRLLLDAQASTGGLFKIRTAPLSPRGSILHVALAGAHTAETVDLLLAHRADAKALDSFGVGLVVQAVASRADEAVLDKLISAGADPNGRDKNGVPALIRAAGNRQQHGLAALLLARGADPFARNAVGQTALDLAIDDEMREIVQEGIRKWQQAETLRRIQNMQRNNKRPEGLI